MSRNTGITETKLKIRTNNHIILSTWHRDKCYPCCNTGYPPFCLFILLCTRLGPGTDGSHKHVTTARATRFWAKPHIFVQCPFPNSIARAVICILFGRNFTPVSWSHLLFNSIQCTNFLSLPQRIFVCLINSYV